MHDSRSDPGVAPDPTVEPVACTLTPADLNARRETLLPGLLARASRRDELPDGYRWTFPSEQGLLEEIARVIEAERHCCRFLAFTISVPHSGGPIRVEATGPAGTKAFLEGLTVP
jgi:hypothetical protein